MAIEPKNQNHFETKPHDTAAHFAPALHFPVIPTPTVETGIGLGDRVRQGFAALKQAILPAKTIVAHPPDFQPIFVVLKQTPQYPDMTPDNTIKHLKNGTSPSQIPPLDYLLKYLRQKHLKTEAVTVAGQRVLRIEIPRWDDKAITQKLNVYFPNSIAQLTTKPDEIAPRQAMPPDRPTSAAPILGVPKARL